MSAPPSTVESLVHAALTEVGAHPAVPFEIRSVSHTTDAIAIDLELQYQRATPVCCGEPGCYLAFLGRARARVPAQLAAALALGAPPRVSMTVRLAYQEGYAHTQLGEAVPCTLDYPADHFG